MVCRKKQELMAEVQRQLVHLAELARAESAAIENLTGNTWIAIDKEIENTIGAKERAIGALREHNEEHGC